jgi:hypothetical protein
VIVTSARWLPRTWPSADFHEEQFQLRPPNEKLTDEEFVRLSRELAIAQPALNAAIKLANMPHGWHRIHYERNPILTLLPDQQESRRILNLLVFESMRQNQKGDTKNALTSCRAALNAARSLGDEPIFISQLIRNAGVVHACQAIERALAQGEPPLEDMSALQKLLENEDSFPGFLTATRGERASMHQLFEAIERGEVSLDELKELTGGRERADWVESTFMSLWHMDTRQEHALYLSLMTRRIKESKLATQEQAASEKRFDQEVRELPKNAFIARMLLPAISKIGDSFRRKDATLRSTIVALAAERYRRDKKTWPDKMGQLCPQYLAHEPLDPFDGAPLRYRRIKDGILIYSVGQDRADNGGNLDHEHPNQPGVDIGVRLWDTAKRRQPPRSKPPQTP